MMLLWTEERVGHVPMPSGALSLFLSEYDIYGMLRERWCRCRTKVSMDDGGIGARDNNSPSNITTFGSLVLPIPARGWGWGQWAMHRNGLNRYAASPSPSNRSTRRRRRRGERQRQWIFDFPQHPFRQGDMLDRWTNNSVNFLNVVRLNSYQEYSSYAICAVVRTRDLTVVRWVGAGQKCMWSAHCIFCPSICHVAVSYRIKQPRVSESTQRPNAPCLANREIFNYHLISALLVEYILFAKFE